ncbi:MAG: HD domain-containing protein [Rhodocyclaceae bacterium]|nr:MAG: HD domain-containing protein [Rhodocyclaceae bacterium]
MQPSDFPPLLNIACTHCGSRAATRLFIPHEEGHACEQCLLDRHLAESGAVVVIDSLYGQFVEALTEALDAREKETGLHSRRTACLTLVLARRFTEDAETLHQVYWGSQLHDVGKVGIPDHILLKQGGLDTAEWDIMRTHVDLGYHIVGKLPAMGDAAELVRCHEERFDGSGYPRKLKGEDIPLGARLFAVIDTLDAMTSDRSYRKALPFDTAKAEIVRMAGSQFDPMAVDAFLAEEAALRTMVALKCNAVNLP